MSQWPSITFLDILFCLTFADAEGEKNRMQQKERVTGRKELLSGKEEVQAGGGPARRGLRMPGIKRLSCWIVVRQYMCTHKTSRSQSLCVSHSKASFTCQVVGD